MSLVEALGYRHRPPTGLQRVVQAAAATRPGSWASAKASPPLDRWAFRVSDGRWTVASVLAGLPVVMLRTTGARSGLERETPLVGIPHEDDLAVIGSGYGQRATPGWVHNLRARPVATVTYRSVAADVVATEPADAGPIWEQARARYPGFAAYPRRAAHRDIAVFVLRPTP